MARFLWPSRWSVKKRKALILVVEDETIVARDIQLGLKGLGYEVPEVAHSGEAALAKVALLKPDLVLMDITLRGILDGVDTASLIRQKFDIPVVYLTAHADEKTFERAKLTEPYGYLLKPFDERDLYTAVEIALYKHKVEHRLRASNQELDAFTYTISHDLRSPLRAINFYAQRLTEVLHEDARDQALSYAVKIQNQSERMAAMIEALLTFSRLGQQTVIHQDLNPREIVEEVIKELKLAEQDNIKLIIHYLPACKADPLLLKQIFANLLNNAMKYSRDRSPIVIEIGHEQSRRGSAYYVKDNGVGFNMAYSDKLFGVFQRLHLDEEFEGHGVGLAIVRRIVDRHGGEIWAEGVEGRGAKFSFTLTRKA